MQLSFSARRLIALSRDLFQASDLGSVVDQIGPALRELLSPDSALVIADIEGSDFAAAFDCRGGVVPVHSAKELYSRVRAGTAKSGRIVAPDVDLPTPGGGEVKHGCLLSISFPRVAPWGAVAALWRTQLDDERLHACEEILACISELTGAAMGNVVNRMILEEKVVATEEVSRVATDHLVQELQRRELEVREKHHVAMTDVLTGMLNRRGFYERAEQGLRLARRQGIECAVIFADVDGLKAINDQFGHSAGDNSLRAAAQVLQDSFRDSDVVARLGGDEFAAFTVDAANTDVIVERIALKAEELYEQGDFPHPVSFSIGVVVCDPSSDLPLAEYLSMADKAMYDQKRKRQHKPPKGAR
jgi:diguanylate cyclase (GGDEF)-like protein